MTRRRLRVIFLYMHGGSPGTPYTRSIQSLFIGSNVYSRALLTSYYTCLKNIKI